MLAEVAGIDAKRSYTMNILHITDLHFGTDRSITERDERHSALEELIVTAQELDASWVPSVVCVSGDLAFAGRPSDYSQFGDWIKRLLTALNLGVERLVVCPRNHDIERAVATTLPVLAHLRRRIVVCRFLWHRITKKPSKTTQGSAKRWAFQASHLEIRKATSPE
jgi:3',5'-cyclic AMP phosphodiesterase CpdA